MNENGAPGFEERDEKIRTSLKSALGMSVPKYISVMYGKSQKAAQIMFNQPETRRPQDEELLDAIYERCADEDHLSAHFISKILGSDPKILNKIQTTIDSRFQSLEADNTIKSLSRPMISDNPEIRQLEMINDKYFFAAVDMQKEWKAAKIKQKEADGKAIVRIPYTMEQIRNAFQVVIDMCLLIIDLKATDNDRRARESMARAYALLSAAAIQMGRYDILESHIPLWRDRFLLHQDPDVPMRVRNLLFQKELWVLKRKGETETGLEVAEPQWNSCTRSGEKINWMDIEPLVCAGLELAVHQLKIVKSDGGPENPETLTQARDRAFAWLQRFEQAPARAEEIGNYLNEDPDLEPLREDSDKPPLSQLWSEMMKKFGVLSLVVVGLLAFGFLSASLAIPAAIDGQIGTLIQAVESDFSQALIQMDADVARPIFQTAGANPGKIIWEYIDQLLGFFSSAC